MSWEDLTIFPGLSLWLWRAPQRDGLVSSRLKLHPRWRSFELQHLPRTPGKMLKIDGVIREEQRTQGAATGSSGDDVVVQVEVLVEDGGIQLRLSKPPVAHTLPPRRWMSRRLHGVLLHGLGWWCGVDMIPDCSYSSKQPVMRYVRLIRLSSSSGQ